MPQGVPHGWVLMTDQQKRDWLAEDRAWRKKVEPYIFGAMTLAMAAFFAALFYIGAHAQ